MPQRRNPTRLKVLRGEKPPKPAAGSAPIARPPAPRWMPVEARREWNRVLREVAEAGRPSWIHALDRAALIAYCMSWSMFHAAARDVAERGILVPGRSSADEVDRRMVKNPSAQLMRDSAAHLRAWAVQFGFTPDSRARIDLGPLKQLDELEEILDGPRAVP